jgi:GntR family galactonate operon transcriptional repressor
MRESNVAPKRLHEQVMRAITERIVTGEWAAGASLPSEAELCVQFGVSRSSVREALRVLAEKGLIEVRHGLGTRVNPTERWDFLDALVLSVRRQHPTTAMVGMIRDLIEARRIVECEVAALAAERATHADLEWLHQALQGMRHSVNDSTAFAEADFDFHRALLETTRNRVLIRMADPIRELLEYSLQATDSVADSLSRALADHEALFDAVKAHDPEAARAAMRAHLDSTADDVAAFGVPQPA